MVSLGSDNCGPWRDAWRCLWRLDNERVVFVAPRARQEKESNRSQFCGWHMYFRTLSALLVLSNTRGFEVISGLSVYCMSLKWFALVDSERSWVSSELLVFCVTAGDWPPLCSDVRVEGPAGQCGETGRVLLNVRAVCDQRQLTDWTLGSQPDLQSKQKRPHRDPRHRQTMFVPDEPFTYSCIPLSLSFGGSSLRGRRLRRWGSTGSWVSGAVSNQQPATHKESGDIIFRSLLHVSDLHAVCVCPVFQPLNQSANFDETWYECFYHTSPSLRHAFLI
jgi:hypothetical protein